MLAAVRNTRISVWQRNHHGAPRLPNQTEISESGKKKIIMQIGVNGNAWRTEATMRPLGSAHPQDGYDMRGERGASAK